LQLQANRKPVFEQQLSKRLRVEQRPDRREQDRRYLLKPLLFHHGACPVKVSD